ncbi:DarT ssDNA thymidine ADP-ribosyltransferase family protein [Butyrivibrio sp. NC2002]|uniref:DarT ssDNA thymidine ADP-ribosyltransferase family protein n=1 Tax=Butyrivibrio sp. NC2002 TaxID=1410610 RepID=UPI000562C089|nr:DarT ssDNA thymidine ADP-ribosyltransferase family protein [Butyrivibrio sp. NC2002]
MGYKEILVEQAQKLNTAYRFWPYYLYHFSDIHNIVNILEEGIVLSRNEAKKNGKMISDNSSERVISRTKEEVFDYARLYFRPLTPTQYHSEGYKPEMVRDIEMNASCPVPVFLVFDADAILSMDNCYFVEQGIAGFGHEKQEGTDAFKRLHFEKIYDNTVYSGERWQSEKKYRMSEVIRKEGFPLEGNLKGIVCRSEAERAMLRHLLRERSATIYEKYKPMIDVRPNFECFFYNGIFVKNLRIHNGLLDIDFNDSAIRRAKVAQIDMKILLSVKGSQGKEVKATEIRKRVDYNEAIGFQIPVEIPSDAESVLTTVLFDGVEMYKNSVPVEMEVFL